VEEGEVVEEGVPLVQEEVDLTQICDVIK